MKQNFHDFDHTIDSSAKKDFQISGALGQGLSHILGRSSPDHQVINDNQYTL